MQTDLKLKRIIGRKIAERIRSRFRKNRISPKSKDSGTTLVESGNLMNSITYKIKGDIISIGTNVKYASIHHFGGLITPKKAKYLAIPLTKAAKVMRPRDFENTFISKGVIFMKNGKKNIALYALKKQVKIPKRPYMFIDTNDKREIEDIISTYYNKIFKQGLPEG